MQNWLLSAHTSNEHYALCPSLRCHLRSPTLPGYCRVTVCIRYGKRGLRSRTSALQTQGRARIKLSAQDSKKNGQANIAREGQKSRSLRVLSSLTSSKLYSWVFSGAILLGLGALCDAGFSGDWSRQGVLTHEQEAAARHAFIGVSLFHLVCLSVALKVVSDRGMSYLRYPLKVLGVGFPALLELLVKDADS